MTDPDRVKEARALLRAQPHHAARFDGEVGPASPPRTGPALSSCLSPVADENWVAMGDAAYCQDPLSGSSIAHALDTGIQAAGTIDVGLRTGQATALTAYAKWVADGFARYWTMRLAYYAMERRWPESPFWRRRQPDLVLQPHDMVALTCDNITVLATEKGRDLIIDQALLARLCATPASAHEIVRCYMVHATVPVPDIEIILAMQRLLQQQVRCVGSAAIARCER